MESIFHRVSVRKFEQKPVEESKLRQILRAGMQAPSAGNQQPWEFFVVRDPAKIKELAATSPYAGCAAQAPVVIVSAYRTQGLRFSELAQIDMSIAQENMWLETDSLGLGGVWLAIAPDKARMENVKEVLGLSNLEPFALFPLGYPAQTKDQQDRFDESRIHWL